MKYINKNNLNDLARDALFAKNYDQLVVLLQQFIESEPNWRPSYWNLGLCYLLANDREQAQNVWMSALLNGNEEEVEVCNLELINILSSSALEFLRAENFKEVQKIIDVLQEIHPNYETSEIAHEVRETVSRLMNDAVAKSLQMNFDEAESIYQKILDLSPRNDEAWQNLGMVNYEKARVALEKAKSCLLESLKLNDSIGIYHYNFGLINETMGQFDLAKQAYREAINLNSENVDAYNNLGLLELKTNNQEAAETTFQECIDKNPRHFGSYINLGNFYFNQEQYTQAIELYEKALMIKPRNPIALENLAIAYEKQGNHAQALSYQGFAYYRSNKIQKAIDYFNEYLQDNVGDKFLYLALSDCYKMLNKRDKAISNYLEGIKIYPKEKGLYRFLFYAYQESGQTDKCMELIKLASQVFAEELTFQRLDQTILPIVYRDEQEIEEYRERFIKSLGDLYNQVETLLNSNKEVVESQKHILLESIGLRTNFYLHYQAKNDLSIQVQYGEIIYEIMKNNFPQFSGVQKALVYPSAEKYKIGYIGSKFQALLGVLFKGWIINSSKTFEIYCYDIDPQVQFNNSEYRTYSQSYYQSSSLEDLCHQIWHDHLDILVFLDLGLNPVMSQLAGLRLAPIQCATWGHPITSGSPTIDYFISSEAIESPEAQAHYSEELICLPNLSIVYPFPSGALKPVARNRHDFSLDNNSVIYLCCQHIPKYLPQYDDLLLQIAKSVDNAKFLFVEGSEGKQAYQQLQERFQKRCQELDIDFEQYFIFSPRFDYHCYFDLLKLSDVFLDTIGFSGGVTTLDVLACDLPVVTLPGEFFRGRQSYGMLKIIGVTETIANSEADYINIAVKLGLDKTYRQEIRAKINSNKHQLYDDKTCVQALEEFYLSAIARYSQMHSNFD